MLYISSDHAGFDLKNRIIKVCQKRSIEIEDLTPDYNEKDDYPDAAQNLAQRLKTRNEKDNDLGIAVCGSGQGICMALNRFSWVRAGLIEDTGTSAEVRKHNHANAICFPGSYSEKVFSDMDIEEIVENFLNTEKEMIDRRVRRVNKMTELGNNCKG